MKLKKNWKSIFGLIFIMERCSQSRLLILFFVIFLIFSQISEYWHIQKFTSVVCNSMEQSEKLKTNVLMTQRTTSTNIPSTSEEPKSTAKKVLIISQFRSGKVEIRLSRIIPIITNYKFKTDSWSGLAISGLISLGLLFCSWIKTVLDFLFFEDLEIFFEFKYFAEVQFWMYFRTNLTSENFHETPKRQVLN